MRRGEAEGWSDAGYLRYPGTIRQGAPALVPFDPLRPARSLKLGRCLEMILIKITRRECRYGAQHFHIAAVRPASIQEMVQVVQYRFVIS
nr:hypothetical protein CFP56_00316 [Quercus suber]